MPRPRLYVSPRTYALLELFMERLSLENMSAAAGVLVKQADDAWRRANPVKAAVAKPPEYDSHVPTPEQLIEDRARWAEADELERVQRARLEEASKAHWAGINAGKRSLEEEVDSLGTYTPPERPKPNGVSTVADQLRAKIKDWPETTKPSVALVKPVKDWE